MTVARVRDALYRERVDMLINTHNKPISTARSLRMIGLWGLLLLVPGVAFAATVKGRVKGHNKLINPVWAEAAKPSTHHYTWREPSPTVRAEFRKLFGLAPKELCIAAVRTDGKVTPPRRPILVTVGGGRTTPVTIVVAPGTRLRFKNNDPFPHRIYAVGEKSFGASDMAIGSSRDWTAPKPGTYEIRDELAPSLRSWVVVKEGVASTGYPNRKGKFFVVLDPGEYRLEAYFAGKQIGKARTITMPERDLDISRQPIVVYDKKNSKPTKK